tara:strand:- start:605 stop:1492 length:888 start_codon:yes stop_codon:yes gene_type:complete
MFYYQAKIFLKRNLKLFLIKIFYLFKLDLIYLKKKDRFEIVLENSTFFKKSSDEEIINAIYKTVPKGCNKELIRIGGTTDGAYLLPDDLDDVEACFSPGTSSCKNFEDDLAQKYNIKSFLADASIDKSKLDLITNLQFFQKKWIGDFDSQDTLSMKSWIDHSGYGNSKNLLLQMDIEGCEYQSLLSMPEKYLKKFKIIVIEFHDLERLEKTRFLNQIFDPVINKILNYFDCVHIHGNNNCGIINLANINIPKVIELTFYRKSCNKGERKKLLPHPLDIKNVDDLPPIVLDKIWTN